MKKIMIVLVVFGLLAIVSHGYLVSAQSAEEGPIRIGVIYPLTGHLALLGDESLRGAEIARVMRNKQGGIAGRRIEYIVGDIPDINAAKSEAERLITVEKVKIITGAYSSSLGLAASEVTCRKGLIYFSVEGIADQFVTRGFKTIFNTDPRAYKFPAGQIEFLQKWLAPKIDKKPSEIRVSFIHEDSAYGSSVARTFVKLAKEKGIQLLSVIPYSAKAVDLSSVILKIRKEKPDAVCAVSYAADAVLLGRQAKELGLDVHAFVGNGGGHSLTSFAEALGSTADGVFTMDFPQFEVNFDYCKGLREYIDAYKQMYNKPPLSGHSTACFVGMNFLFGILDKTGGSLDPQGFRKAALAYEVKHGDSANGWGCKFAENGENLWGEVYLAQWKGGKLVTVWPDGPAKMKAEYIKPFSQ
jgi:branched-chain amino acid transport system substrate-binding protein